MRQHHESRILEGNGAKNFTKHMKILLTLPLTLFNLPLTAPLNNEMLYLAFENNRNEITFSCFP